MVASGGHYQKSMVLGIQFMYVKSGGAKTEFLNGSLKVYKLKE